MKRYLLAAAAVTVLAGCASTSDGGYANSAQAAADDAEAAAAAAEAAAAPAANPTAADAKAFVDAAETDLAKTSEYINHVSWIRNTYIMHDSMLLESDANARATELAVKYAKEAARFDNTPDVDPVTRRKLLILKTGLVLPAPDKPGAADELAQIGTRMDSTYSTGKFVFKGKTLTLDDASDILASSRNPADLKAVWEGWRTVSPPMKADYARMVEISNEGSRDLGFADTGALWRSGYDMPPDEFAAYTDKLWSQVEPFYKNLHCYVRARLNEKYGDAVQPRTGPIRADLVGNMWGQEWGGIYDVVAPKTKAGPGYDLDKLLVAKHYDATRMMKTGEGFYSSIGMAPLPQTFWERSMITRPKDREVVCHASAWDIDNREDVRIKMCTKVNGEDFRTVHHELGHNYYQRAYMDQPFLFKNGANDGFHEAIGDFAALSAVTPEYLNQIGLLDKVPQGTDGDIPFLMHMALDKIAFLPFGLMVDRWRWDVYSGRTTPDQYNAHWWELVNKYQGLTPPGARPADAFDPGAKYHVAASVPYTRYFLAHILQFQFQRAACQQAGWKGPIYRCSIYGQKGVGGKFNAMLEMGQSQPWPVALETFTGQRDIDATAVVDYFAPLNSWLIERNKGEQCGW